MVTRILAGVVVAVAVAAVGFSIGLPDSPQGNDTSAAVGALPVAEHSCCMIAKKSACESEVQAVEAVETAETCPLKAAANGEAVAAFTGGMSVGVSTVKFNCCAD